MFSVKSVKDKDSRRFNLSSCSFGDLTAMLVTLYKPKTAVVDPVFHVTYKDDEDEIITISSDMELKEAFDVSKAAGLMALKLFVVEQQVSEAKQSTPAASIPRPTLLACAMSTTTASPSPSTIPVPAAAVVQPQLRPTVVPPSFSCTAACCKPTQAPIPSVISISCKVPCNGPCCRISVAASSSAAVTNSASPPTVAATHICVGSCCKSSVAASSAISTGVSFPLTDDTNLTASPVANTVTSTNSTASSPVSDTVTNTVSTSVITSTATAVPVSKHAQELESLAAMGFVNSELNEFLLEHNKGHMGEVVNWLLQNGSQ